MAYGKIKADAIIYDNSGSDVEKTLASLAAAAPTASPTFTGTVTIPTASANDNTTKAASTAYVQTELGDYATLASPALTGTATAVNLTLSGNLTVNGTTTTVASTNTTITDNLLELNSGASSNANDSGIIIERGSTGDNAIFAWDESADKFIVGTTTGTASSTGDITIAAGGLVAGTIEDSKGDVRKIPQNEQNSAYTLVAADAGKHVSTNSAVTIPSGVFSVGDAITIYSYASSDIAITRSGVTLWNAADGTNADRTLSTRGLATLLCTATNTFVISGAGLS